MEAELEERDWWTALLQCEEINGRQSEKKTVIHAVSYSFYGLSYQELLSIITPNMIANDVFEVLYPNIDQIREGKWLTFL